MSDFYPQGLRINGATYMSAGHSNCTFDQEGGPSEAMCVLVDSFLSHNPEMAGQEFSCPLTCDLLPFLIRNLWTTTFHVWSTRKLINTLTITRIFFKVTIMNVMPEMNKNHLIWEYSHFQGHIETKGSFKESHFVEHIYNLFLKIY